MTMSPRSVRSSSASSTIAVGLTVGWSSRPRRASEPARRRRIGPDVRAPAPAFAKLDVVDVRGGAVLEHGQQLVLGPVEAAHAGVGLRPDDQVEGFEAELDRRGVDGRVSAPVDESAKDGTVAEAAKDRRHPGSLKGGEFGVGHPARRHGEFAMLAAGHMSDDRDVVGLVGHDQARRASPSGSRRNVSGSVALSQTIRCGPRLRNVPIAGDGDCVSLRPERPLLKRLVVLVGQKKAIAIAVRNVSGRRRWSKLDEWLRVGALSRSSNSSKAD